jgi:hypothetical protein
MLQLSLAGQFPGGQALAGPAACGLVGRGFWWWILDLVIH